MQKAKQEKARIWTCSVQGLANYPAECFRVAHELRMVFIFVK